ncbi:TetR/AcrR family transcriptional regulator [Rhizobium sp. P38BS-XIX]|uniref:TetR/AcrR family transcriptional regulator n=1 Tax=Rhizobium sp. P38BS-XIX TaxID=2726740 RepID=UPI001456D8E0|nr:TetR/AcrR family transcriptional regulator [Rhizobium sp. P38BS-XIX]NLR99379.1 TetR/AcrR family transcriptional regulator [Rhizobium sp. P38BS-XIX]
MEIHGSEDTPRPRNAAATRAAILESARLAFIRSGYEGAGVREIAKGAGVTAMLINRYFGSKEELFAEVLERANENPIIATSDNLRSPDRARIVARMLLEVTAPNATALDGFMIMLRSASSDAALEIGRKVVEKQNQRNITAALSGKAAPQRAAVLLSLVAGVQIMRQMIGLTAMNAEASAELQAILEPIVRQLMDAEETAKLG